MADSLEVSLNNAVAKAKLAIETGVGTKSLIATDLFSYEANPGAEDTERVVGAGISRYNFKIVQVKGKTDLVGILSYSSKAAGSAVFMVPSLTSGVVEGSIKISGAKVIPLTAPSSK